MHTIFVNSQLLRLHRVTALPLVPLAEASDADAPHLGEVASLGTAGCMEVYSNHKRNMEKQKTIVEMSGIWWIHMR